MGKWLSVAIFLGITIFVAVAIVVILGILEFKWICVAGIVLLWITMIAILFGPDEL